MGNSSTHRVGCRKQLLEHFDKCVASTPIDLPFQILQKLLTTHSNTLRILEAFFSRMEENYWYSMMKEDGDKIDNAYMYCY